MGQSERVDWLVSKGWWKRKKKALLNDYYVGRCKMLRCGVSRMCGVSGRCVVVCTTVSSKSLVANEKHSR